jgi:hypothetical protein
MFFICYSLGGLVVVQVEPHLSVLMDFSNYYLGFVTFAPGAERRDGVAGPSKISLPIW